MPLGLMLGGLDAGWAFQPLQPGNLFALRRHHLPQRSDFGQQLHDQRLELGRVQRIRVERQWHPQVESQNRREANRKMSAAAETAPTCDVSTHLTSQRPAMPGILPVLTRTTDKPQSVD